MAFTPIVKMKMDELFIRWLTDQVTQASLNQSLVFLKANDRTEAKRALRRIAASSPVALSSNNSESLPAVPSSLLSSCVSPRPLTPPHFPNVHRQSQSPRPSSLPTYTKFIVRFLLLCIILTLFNWPGLGDLYKISSRVSFLHYSKPLGWPRSKPLLNLSRTWIAVFIFVPSKVINPYHLHGSRRMTCYFTLFFTCISWSFEEYKVMLSRAVWATGLILRSQSSIAYATKLKILCLYLVVKCSTYVTS